MSCAECFAASDIYTNMTDAAVNDGARKQGNTTENLIFSEIIRIVENNSRK